MTLFPRVGLSMLNPSNAMARLVLFAPPENIIILQRFHDGLRLTKHGQGRRDNLRRLCWLLQRSICSRGGSRKTSTPKGAGESPKEHHPR
mmetsp:Transcript_26277/g.42447  ORF Transcript_26277/g.42447 Transcript_26277/m.42447 type:complete len:90 (-) Transcript_26277:52-321(-)